MYRTILTLTLASTLSLSACAAQPVWTKPGVSFESWRSDQYSCERDTRMSAASFGGGLAQGYYAQQFYNRCLQAKGYHQVKE
jgi:hypothetical protein